MSIKFTIDLVRRCVGQASKDRNTFFYKGCVIFLQGFIAYFLFISTEHLLFNDFFCASLLMEVVSKIFDFVQCLWRIKDPAGC